MKSALQISFFLAVVLTAFLLDGCGDAITQYPNTPAIAFKSYDRITYYEAGTKKDSLLFHIDFTDGDGDIGLGQGDTLPPYDTTSIYYYDLYALYYERINGEYVQVTPEYPFYIRDDTIRYNGRLPVITPTGKLKGIKGEIEYGIDMGTGPIAGDAIKFKIWVYDRALHKSNVIESPEIVLN